MDAQKAAADKFRAARITLDSLELRLGWTPQDLAALGLRKSTPKISGDVLAGRWFSKILGVLMTALAISLGAPFWFDTLNKVISIRAAGRSPTERAKSPEGQGKRAAEQPNK